MKIHIKDIPQAESEKILSAIERVTGIFIHDENNCGQTIENLIWHHSPKHYEANIRLIALHALGNTLPRHLKWLVAQFLAGDGDCPKCGSNDVEGVSEITCNNCGHSWYYLTLDTRELLKTIKL